MIDGKNVYHVVEALVPLYVAMFLAYASVRWWGIFTPVQCSGINRFVAMFAAPVLSFNFISGSNIYAMNYTFIAADALQKVFVLAVIAAFLVLRRFIFKFFSFDDEWLITAFSVSTVPNTLVVGLPLIKAMYGESQGNLLIQIIVFQGLIWYNILIIMFEYRAANNLLSDKFPDQANRIASVKVDSDVISLSGIDPLDTEADSDTDGRLHVRVKMKRQQIYGSSDMSSSASYSFRRTLSDMSGVEIYSVQSSSPSRNYNLDSFVYDVYDVSSTLPPSRKNSMIRCPPPSTLVTTRQSSSSDIPIASENGGSGVNNNNITTRRSSSSNWGDDDDKRRSIAVAAPAPAAAAGVVTKVILVLIWRKLSRNPNTYSSILGVVWSLIANRYGVKFPKIVQGCITVLANTGLGMAVFSLGLFMALQPKIISCGKKAAGISMGLKFLVGPAVMAVTSLALGIRGTLLRVAIVQAAVPAGIVPFIFAKEYNVHADILSTCVIFGMLLALPVSIIYNILLGL